MEYSRLVYSTDGGRVDTCATCGHKLAKCTCRRAGRGLMRAKPAPAVPNDGVVRVFRDRGGRGGKTVTVVTGVPTNTLAAVAQTLKRAAAAGGNVRAGTIELQGDHRDLVAARLGALGYRVKLAGG